MNYKRGDIVWIGESVWKGQGKNAIKAARPGIIVSSDVINAANYTAEVVFLTTHPKHDANTNVTIRSAKAVSVALCGQITTVSSEQIGELFGTCTEAEMATIDRALLTSLHLEFDAAEYTEQFWSKKETEAEMYALRQALAAAKAEAETIKKMYDELLLHLISAAIK